MIYYTLSMMEFQEKIRIRRFIYSKVTLIILLIAIFFISRAVLAVYKKQRMTSENLTKTTTTFESLKLREMMLSSEIESLKTDSGKEDEIRERYGLVKPGEEVIVVVDEGNKEDTDSESTSGGFWQTIKSWFK
jgi:cell division protein FtsB